MKKYSSLVSLSRDTIAVYIPDIRSGLWVEAPHFVAK